MNGYTLYLKDNFAASLDAHGGGRENVPVRGRGRGVFCEGRGRGVFRKGRGRVGVSLGHLGGCPKCMFLKSLKIGEGLQRS